MKNSTKITLVRDIETDVHVPGYIVIEQRKFSQNITSLKLKRESHDSNIDIAANGRYCGVNGCDGIRYSVYDSTSGCNIAWYNSWIKFYQRKENIAFLFFLNQTIFKQSESGTESVNNVGL